MRCLSRSCKFFNCCRKLCNATEPKFSLAKDDVTPFKVNGDASTLPDQRIPTATCESSVREGPGSVENIMSRAGTQDWAPGRAQRLQTGGPHFTHHEDTGAAGSTSPETSD